MVKIPQVYIFIILFISSCNAQSDMKHTNALIEETSPYLLQHAHNPVDWMPWNEETLEMAQRENKPLIISIGYSACHWCHVMEHESFEDEEVAQIMNENFICIKVDREERPDVDQVYMDAVQLMTGSGGWPLNCFALPDGRPFFGGTYFRKGQWKQTLFQLSKLYKSDYNKVEEYAIKLTEGLNEMDMTPLVDAPSEFDAEILKTALSRWQKTFDHKEGGPNRAPKFPLPNNYEFLLAYAHQNDDKALLDYVQLTLKKMAYGGIYDQIGGGFARYSTDEVWKVPHFEKMLYDNGQLLSLYAKAYQQNGDSLYKQILLETKQWLKEEMIDKSGAFYSALDADSEGEEGKFYTWTLPEIESLSGEHYEIIKQYYNINPRGKWDKDSYILLRHDDDLTIAQSFGITAEKLHEIVRDFDIKAKNQRNQRVKPGLDDKTLTSWNALTSKGLVDMYLATGDEDALTMAKSNLDFLTSTQMRNDGGLWHSYKGGKSSINGYLEDYASLIDALLRYYEATFDVDAILTIKKLVEYVFEHFDQSPNGIFYFKSKDDEALVAKKSEITDNVIPASNSILATCFYKLGLLLADDSLLSLSSTMLAQVESSFAGYPSGYSQWMMLHHYRSSNFFEVAIVGNQWLEKHQDFQSYYLPNVLFCGGDKTDGIPILEHKLVEDKTLVYVCKHRACQAPTTKVDEAIVLLR